MSYTPLNYNQINAQAGLYNPSPVKAYNNQTFAYWQRSLFQRMCSVIDFDVDDKWQGKTKDFLYYCIFKYGFVAVFDVPEFGFSFQPCTLYGYDFYYQPTKCVISNPLFNKELEIGKDCELLKLTPDYYGVWDIINYYAEKLSELDSAINMSIINSKMAYVMGAKNKAAAEAIKKVFDKVNKGEPTVVYDIRIADDPATKSTPFQFLERSNLKQSYLTTDQLADFSTILKNFDSEIGIPSVDQKKERMVISEAETKQIDATARATSWIECLNQSFDIINAHYGTSMSAKLRFESDMVTSDPGEEQTDEQ